MQEEWTAFENILSPIATTLSNHAELERLKRRYLDFVEEVALAADDSGALRETPQTPILSGSIKKGTSPANCPDRCQHVSLKK
jgi:hypothetical protein